MQQLFIPATPYHTMYMCVCVCKYPQTLESEASRQGSGDDSTEVPELLGIREHKKAQDACENWAPLLL